MPLNIPIRMLAISLIIGELPSFSLQLLVCHRACNSICVFGSIEKTAIRFSAIWGKTNIGAIVLGCAVHSPEVRVVVMR